MEFEWGERKRSANLAKHGFDLASIPSFDWRGAVFRHDDYLDGELRSRAIGFLGERLVSIVYTIRGNSCRVISMRKASSSECRIYGNE